jgi:hypothetical protein
MPYSGGDPRFFNRLVAQPFLPVRSCREPDATSFRAYALTKLRIFDRAKKLPQVFPKKRDSPLENGSSFWGQCGAAVAVIVAHKGMNAYSTRAIEFLVE